MAKAIADAVLDAALAKIATSDRMTVCSGEPANFAGIAAVLLVTHVLTAGSGNGDWTIAAGTQRKVTTTQQAAVSITNSGTATHVCYDDGTTLLAVTTCTSQVLTSGGTVTVPAFKFEFAAPS
jgi:hypothetical protein